MDNKPVITMGGRFRLFPLATIPKGNGPREERKEETPPSTDVSPTPIAVKEERKLSSAPAKTDPPKEDDGARSAPEEVEQDLPPAKKEYRLTPEPPDTDFRKEFPPDPTIGSELDEAARVWMVYRREAEEFDRTLLQGWSETLDILLIFAALFSAVATAFIIESYQLLQLDNSAYTAAALYNLVVAGTQSTAAVPLPIPPDLAFKTPVSRWINGLWFTSILLSLAVGLLSILAKQWITQYRARNNASAKNPRDWARRREIYFKVLNSWPVAEVVALLPVLLHLSLFLFFAGVVAFLWNLDQAIAVWLVALGGFLGIFYIGCTLVPLRIPESPTSTPLAMLIRTAVLSIVLFSLKSGLSALYKARRIRAAVVSRIRRIRAAVAPRIHRISQTWGSLFPRPVVRVLYYLCMPVLLPLAGLICVAARCYSGCSSACVGRRLENDSTTILPMNAPSPSVKSPTISDHLASAIKHVEAMRGDESGIRPQLEQKQDELDASALLWLIFEVSDSNAVAVGIQALGALRWNSPLADLLRGDDRLINFPEAIAFTRSASRRTSTEVLRVSRSVLVMCRHGRMVELHSRVPSLYDLDDKEYPDIALLHLQFSRGLLVVLPYSIDRYSDSSLGRLNAKCDSIAANITVWREVSPSLASTALCALRANWSYAGRMNVICCDLDHWSDAEWTLALSVCHASDCPHDFAKPFHLAFEFSTSTSYQDSYWASQVARRSLNHVREPVVEVSSSYNRLPFWALNFLGSQRFYDLHLEPKALVTLSLYFRLDEQLAPFFDVPYQFLEDFHRSPGLFWGSFARVVHALISSPSLTEVDVGPTAKVCSHALHVLLTLKNISRSSVLNLFLIMEGPYPSTDFIGLPASLWAMLGTMTNRSGAWIEVAAALAAYLDVYLRARPDTFRKAEWIDAFFAELSDNALVKHAEDSHTQSKREQFIHLLQHCIGLRPNWCFEVITRVGDSGSRDLQLRYGEASPVRRGRCQCPVFRPEYAP